MLKAQLIVVALALGLIAGAVSAQNGVLTVSDATGATVLQLTPSDKGFLVSGKGGAGLGKVKVEPDRVKVADAAGKPAYKVKDKDGGFKLYKEPTTAGAADIEQAAFWWENDGFQVKDPNDREIIRGKGRGVALKVRCADGRAFSFKPAGNGIEVDDAAGKKLVSVQGTQSAAAALFCVLKEYDPLQKAAVLAHVSRLKR
jgi:uncharacterized protein YxjI